MLIKLFVPRGKGRFVENEEGDEYKKDFGMGGKYSGKIKLFFLSVYSFEMVRLLSDHDKNLWSKIRNKNRICES